MKKILAAVLVSALAFGMTNVCFASEDPLAGIGNIDDIRDADVTIGISQMSLAVEYQVNLTTLIQKIYEENYPNVKVIITDAEADAVTQVNQVEDLISHGVDAILMCPYDRYGCIPAVDAAVAAGVPIIELCQETASPDRTSFVGSYHHDSGVMTMQALADKLGGKGKVIFLEGPIGQDSSIARTEAAMEIIDANPDLEVVVEKVCDWDRAAAMSAVENYLQSSIDFDAIFAESDSMALGAMEALKGAKQEEEIIVGGIDLIEDAYYSIAEGGLYCTSFQNFIRQAEVGAEIAVRAALGQEVEKSYVIPFELITLENVSDYEYVFAGEYTN